MMYLIIGLIVVIIIVGVLFFLKKNADEDDYEEDYEEDIAPTRNPNAPQMQQQNPTSQINTNQQIPNGNVQEGMNNFADSRQERADPQGFQAQAQSNMQNGSMQNNSVQNGSMQNNSAQNSSVQDNVGQANKNHNHIEIAQQYLQQQRYDDAEHVLTSALKLYPDDSTISLKLLNIYATTRNVDSFQVIFDHISSRSSADVIRQAKEIKSLLDDETASSQKFTSAPVQSEQEDNQIEQGLDFDAFLAQESSNSQQSNLGNSPSQSNAPQPKVQQEEQEFDIFDNSDSLDNDFGIKSEKNVANKNDITDEFNLSLDNDSTNTQTRKSDDLDLNSGKEDDLVFDSSVDSKPAQKVTTANNTESSVDGSFDLFELGDDDNNKSKGNATNSSVTTADEMTLDDFNINTPVAKKEVNDFDDFSLKLDAPSPSSPTSTTTEQKQTVNSPSPVAQEDNASFDDFSLELDAPSPSSPASTTTEQKQTVNSPSPVAQEDNASFDDFSLELDAPSPSSPASTTTEQKQAVNSPSPVAQEDNANFDDFSLELDAPSPSSPASTTTEQKQAVNSPSPVQEDNATFDDFSLDLETENKTVVNPVSQPLKAEQQSTNELEFNDFDFDINTDNKQTTDGLDDMGIVKTDVKETKSQELSLDSFDDFRLDDTNTTAKTANPTQNFVDDKPAEDKLVSEPDFDDFSIDELEITELSKSKETTNLAKGLDLNDTVNVSDEGKEPAISDEVMSNMDTLTQLDNLNFSDNEDLSNADLQAKQPTQSENIIKNNFIESQEQVTESAPVTTVPVGQTSQAIDTNIDIINGLDDTKVTLDLAHQYLNLGEYDSAKRLLDEVMQTGSSEQQAKAQLLLDHTG